MIRRDICLEKINTLKADIDYLSRIELTSSQEAYLVVLKRQLAGWQREYIKALQRREPKKGY